MTWLQFLLLCALIVGSVLVILARIEDSLRRLGSVERKLRALRETLAARGTPDR